MPRQTPILVAGLLLSLATLPLPAWQESEPEPEDDNKKSEWSERVVVTAEVEGAASAPRGASTTVLEPTRSADPPQALTDLIAIAPAVSENGQGGLFQNVSIRGVSRQRVRHMISGVRITDERRAGPASSFVDPLLMGSVEVLRGPATTFHGSGALGGTIQALPRRFEAWTVQSGWSSQGDGRFLMVGGGGDHWSVGVARREQDNAEAADGTLLNDHFEQTSAVLRFDWGAREKRTYSLLLMPSRADDIGKANSDFPARATNYPDEEHDVFEFTVAGTSGWQLTTYLHDRDLQTRITQPLETGDVTSGSTDYGVSWNRSDRIGKTTAIHWGFDVFGRTAVDSTETLTVTDPMNPSVTVSQPLDAGREEEWGGFAVARWTGGGAEWEGGMRMSLQHQGNRGDGSLDRSALNGFVGVVKPIGTRWEIRGAASSGERFPSLGELFFTGVTGRGTVFGNAALESERALNTELGFAYKGSRLILRSAVFRNDIDNYIERIVFAPDMLTFINRTSGKIDGLELSAIVRSGANWLVSFGGHVLEGRANDGTPLADVPPHEVWSEARWRRGKFQVNARLAHRSTKDDPGSGENAIPSVDLLSFSGRYQATQEWAFYAGVRNALDELYFRSADDKAPPALGRVFSAGLIWGF